jgi:hypothetical protein
MHPHATRDNPYVTLAMSSYHGGVSRYGVELVPGGQRKLLGSGWQEIVDMDDELRLIYGDQPPSPSGLHYMDAFGYAYVDDLGYLIGVATEAGHMLVKGHPWLGK